MDSSGFVRKVKELNLRNSGFIDETADEEITKKYDKFLPSYKGVPMTQYFGCNFQYNSCLIRL